MRTVSRIVLALALLLALVPLTAFADESSEYPTEGLTPDQAMIVQAERQLDAATTPADIANATAIYELRMGAAMGNAEAAVNEAQAMVTAHPESGSARAQLTAAQNNYTQLLKLCGITLTETMPPITMVASEGTETFDIQGGSLATLPMH